MKEQQRSGVFPRGSEEFSRVLNFSDGVMAIALTLLVLNIDLPVPSSEQLASQTAITPLLLRLAPQLSAFLVSFVIVAYSWIGHHRLLASLSRIDGAFISWNFCFLLIVVLVPLQAELIGLYGDNPQALSLYSLGFALLFGLDLLGQLLAWKRRLVPKRPSSRWRRYATVAKAIPAGVFLLTIPASHLLGTGIASWLWLAIWPLEAGLGRLLPINPRPRCSG